ncbi:hypothetical protein GDO81_017113 [Engystomops pustulosus]|uniref:Vomeronasal type-1 receptor n=1 Tax=Engystomops pustulosus TaxID=76066 RepID=A0AAV7ABG6_ENGPU|nr:hypothetical protein GDO81_017113 [Engystomops pustulosus]
MLFFCLSYSLDVLFLISYLRTPDKSSVSGYIYVHFMVSFLKVGSVLMDVIFVTVITYRGSSFQSINITQLPILHDICFQNYTELPSLAGMAICILYVSHQATGFHCRVY